MPISEEVRKANTSIQATRMFELNLDHFEAMFTHVGMWQHAKGRQPDRGHGYSIDDEARALIVALQYLELAPDRQGTANGGRDAEFMSRVAEVCFHFLENAAVVEGDSAGRFHNFCDEHGKWLDGVGSDDSFGRTLWALGVALRAGVNVLPIDRVQALFEAALPICGTLVPLRSKAFAILGLTEALQAGGSQLDDDRVSGLVETLADSLVDAYRWSCAEDWRWFENCLTYCNARLPHALFAASQIALGDKPYTTVAVDALDFLLKITHNEKGSYSPIGNAPLSKCGWFNRGESHPPLFDQQPVDAGALVEACAAAHAATAEPRFRKAAHQAYGWYFGDNVHGLPLYDASTGGVCDALTPGGVNTNMGAESVLSIHLAAQALHRLESVLPD